MGRVIHGEQTDRFQRWYAHMSKQLGRQPPQRLESTGWTAAIGKMGG
ncbi:MAG: hypothetical protein KDE48_04710 [Anaerolineales bacterium]|nr:hypothetical protein [Anaerolineales bacterium]